MSKPVPKHAKYAPTHRQRTARPRPGLAAPKKALRKTLLLSSIAVTATGVAVSGGLMAHPFNASNAAESVGSPATQPSSATTSEVNLRERLAAVSRSDRRDQADPVKEAALAPADGPAMTRTEDLSGGDPREIAKALLTEFGFSQDQFSCLDSLYMGESGWRVNADNPYSSAYGIPQALPGSKMSSAGADWATNPVTQIRWGLGYITDRYGSPCGAMSFKSGHGWY